VPLVRAYHMVHEAEELISEYNEFQKASAMLTGALDFIEKSHIHDKWVKAAAQANLAYAQQQLFDYQQALHYYAESIPVLAQEPVKDRRFFGIRLLGYAECMSLASSPDVAERLCFMAADNLLKALGQNDPIVGLAFNNLASYIMLNGKFAEAAPHAERAFDILSLLLGKHNEATKNCAVNLAKIYKELNRTEDLEALDAKFTTEDEPILPRQTGEFAPEYIESLKQKWRSQGPRKIFDPPGLHRSSELSAKSYKAFVKAWTAKMPVSPAGASVLAAEIRSLGYAFDKLPEYKKPKMPPGTTGILFGCP
jgi:tetratricopeptide (TPR) repeat protein